MTPETKTNSIELLGMGIAKILSNYSETALLINACNIAANRYKDKTDTTHLSTTANIPPDLRLDNEIEINYTNENLVAAYNNNVLTRVLENYVIASVSIVDGIMEDLYEIILQKEEPDITEREIEKRVITSWRNDSLLKYLIEPKGLNLKEPKGFVMKYTETFFRYYELRILRHSIVHTAGQLSEKDYKRLEFYRDLTDDQRKHVAIINSPLLDNERQINLSINNILSIRQFLDRFLMFFYKSIEQKVTV